MQKSHQSQRDSSLTKEGGCHLKTSIKRTVLAYNQKQTSLPALRCSKGSIMCDIDGPESLKLSQKHACMNVNLLLAVEWLLHFPTAVTAHWSVWDAALHDKSCINVKIIITNTYQKVLLPATLLIQAAVVTLLHSYTIAHQFHNIIPIENIYSL